MHIFQLKTELSAMKMYKANLSSTESLLHSKFFNYSTLLICFYFILSKKLICKPQGENKIYTGFQVTLTGYVS